MNSWVIHRLNEAGGVVALRILLPAISAVESVHGRAYQQGFFSVNGNYHAAILAPKQVYTPE